MSHHSLSEPEVTEPPLLSACTRHIPASLSSSSLPALQRRDRCLAVADQTGGVCKLSCQSVTASSISCWPAVLPWPPSPHQPHALPAQRCSSSRRPGWGSPPGWPCQTACRLATSTCSPALQLEGAAARSLTNGPRCREYITLAMAVLDMAGLAALGLLVSSLTDIAGMGGPDRHRLCCQRRRSCWCRWAAAEAAACSCTCTVPPSCWPSSPGAALFKGLIAWQVPVMWQVLLGVAAIEVALGGARGPLSGLLAPDDAAKPRSCCCVAG